MFDLIDFSKVKLNRKVVVIVIALGVIAGFFRYSQTDVQENKKTPEFHRLIITNDKNQLLVVKIKDKDFWVTQGMYDSQEKVTNKDLHKLAADYGLTITEPKLRGKFILKRNANTSIRHFYTAITTSGSVKLPDNIDGAEWLPLYDAVEKITFPHIGLMLSKIMDGSNTVYSGSVLRYKEGKEFKAKVTKPFFTEQKQ
jgi:hypothetical protein